MKPRSQAAVAAAFLAGFAATAPCAASAQGLYAHCFAGMTMIDSTITVGGQKLVDAGGDAVIGGCGGGWGHRWPSGLYLGAEAEGWGGSGRSRVVVNGQPYSLDVNGGAGAFARAGWMTRGGALFYARGGVQATFTNDGTRTMPAVGGGAEVPIAGRWFARIDVTYAWEDRDRREFLQSRAGVGVRF